MIGRWMSMSWRMALAMVVTTLLFGMPITYILFASTPLDPWASFLAWQPDHFGLRLASVALFIALLSLVFSFLGNRSKSHPFQEIAAIIRQIGTGDFQVRIGYSRKEPRELVKIREALNEMAAALQRAEELRTNLIADVSHELRTPLTALEGNLRAALDRVYPLDEAEIANLYAQTRHLIRLVNDLHVLALADARRLPLAMHPTDLNELLQETLSLFAPLAEEQNVRLCAAVAALPIIEIDAVRIRQVVHNLLTNALRHTPAGGEITVSAKTEAEHVVISVSDTGDGLEPEHIDAIFNRFYRTDKSRSRDTGGTGLGLSIASAFVAAHNGSIIAKSDGIGTGSTFIMRLPLQQELSQVGLEHHGATA